MIWVIISIVAVVVIGIAIWAAGRRSGGAPGGEGPPGVVTADAGPGRPRVAEFHVRGNEAQVSFEVPLPAGEVDEVLRDLLVREAVEVVREKRHSLPITDVTRVVALGRRDGQFVAVGGVDLATPGELPPPIRVESVHAHKLDFDPFEAVASAGPPPGVAVPSSAEDLAPISSELRIPAGVAAGLRTQGVDPSEAGAGDVVLGMLRLTGHTVAVRGGEDTYTATKGGQTTLVRVVPHRPGSHPELDESEVKRFAVDFASSGAGRGLLVTEKFGPFEVYDRERREPRVRFVTRERLQSFVDALSLG